MSQEIEPAKSPITDEEARRWTAIQAALASNDYSKLTDQERAVLLNKTCESMGLNPLGQPFGFFKMKDGKVSLYAKRACSDQLGKIHGLSIIECGESFNEKTRILTVKVKMRDRDGRESMNRGDVFISPSLAGEDLANAYMRCHTKAVRRCTLAMCGLGFLDETEVEDIRQPQKLLPGKSTAISFASQAQKADLVQFFKKASEVEPNLPKLYNDKFPGVDIKALTVVQYSEIRDWLNGIGKLESQEAKTV